MALFRCKACQHLREVSNEYQGKSVRCPKCRETGQVYNTVSFVSRLITAYQFQRHELSKPKFSGDEGNTAPTTNIASDVFADVDIHDTTYIAQQEQYQPIIDWFKKRNLEIAIDSEANDTSGFYDEIALELGTDFATLGLVSKQIHYIQRKGFKQVKLQLNKKPPEDIAKIRQFCRLLYDYSFVARFDYDKDSNTIKLIVQNATPIVQFFKGTWLEWYVFIKLLAFFQEEKSAFSCLRSVALQGDNGTTNELDVFLLIENGLPVCIECKTGEYRHDLQKYSTLRKTLKLEKDQFLLCIAGLDETESRALGATYGITFVNEITVVDHVKSLTEQA